VDDEDEPEYRFLNAKSCEGIFKWIKSYQGFPNDKSHHAPEWCGKTGYLIANGLAWPGDTIRRDGKVFTVAKRAS
jgi:hypothetical protein